MNTCKHCGRAKPWREFSKNKTYASGRTNQCKDCKRDYEKAYSKENSAKHVARAKSWKQTNKAKAAAHAKKAREKNRDYHNAKDAERRAKVKMSMPAWADERDVMAIYQCRKRVSECVGVAFHVDHIIPLSHELVSGLHVPANMQVIPASQNLRKSNAFSV